MSIHLKGEIKEIAEGVNLLSKLSEFNADCNISVKKCESGFRINVKNNSAEIHYCRKIDFFRAFTLAVNSLKKGEDTELEEEPSFKTCGIMLDASRGAVLKTSSVKEFIRYMARMGLNRLMLYTEDTYEIEKYPYFGYMRGRYTKEELKEIDEYADIFGIEAVPCIQTLAHLSKALRWREFSEVKDTNDILLIGEDKTYELIEEMIKTMRSCFKSDEIHIGMDEAHMVGLGEYLRRHGYKNRFELLKSHLSRVVKIAEKYGFKPMMWSDMFFRLGTSDGGYYDIDAELLDNIEDLIPEGLSQVYWDYYNNSSAMYEKMISEHKKMNRRIIFAGGIWMWGAPSVNYRQTFSSMLPALKACRKYGIEDVVATMWCDDGGECDFREALYGMQLFAEQCYERSYSEDILKSRFAACCGMNADIFLLFDTEDFDEHEDKPFLDFAEGERNIVTLSKQLLYQDVLLGFFDKNASCVKAKEHYTALYEKLVRASFPKELKALFEYHRQLVNVLKIKCDMGIRLKAAYDSGNSGELIKIAHELDVLADEFSKLYKLRKELWYESNKPFGFEEVGGRLVCARAQTELAAERVRDFLNGKIEKIEELEQERLWYNSFEGAFYHDYFAERIMKP